MEMNRAGSQALSILTLALSLLFLLFLSACDVSDGDDGKDLTEPSAVLKGTFVDDVLPLFTENDVYFSGALSCTTCHFSNAAASSHMLDLTSYDGILTGADAGAEDIMGRSGACVGSTDVGDCPVDWGESGLRGRLRNNRMPPGWNFDLNQDNRDTAEVKIVQGWIVDGAIATETNGGAGPDATDRIGYNSLLSVLGFASAADVTATGRTDIAAGDVIVDATTAFAATDLVSGDTSLTVGELFTLDGIFFEGSQACSTCHGDPAVGFSWHDLDFSSRAGILTGADAGEEDILGRTDACVGSTDVAACPPDWGESGLKRRMRNSRMPPGWTFDLSQTNRDMWAIETIACWAEDGAVNGSYDCRE